MKTGVLLVAHGSRILEANTHAVAVGRMVQEKYHVEPLVVSFMAHMAPNIEQGVEQLVDQGVEHIKVIPLFLYNGLHIQEDIPNELADVKERFPNVEITFGRALGADERLAQLVFERIQEVS